MPFSRLARLRTRAMKTQDGLCYYCRQPMWSKDARAFCRTYNLSITKARLFECTAEHLRARRDGGGDNARNIVAACWRCNQKRHQSNNPLAAPEYRRYVRARIATDEWPTVKPA